MTAHLCHAYRCNKPVPQRMFMCSTHWFQLPKQMRDAVWEEYVPGQEVRWDVTEAYLNVTHRAIRWLKAKEYPETIVAGALKPPTEPSEDSR